MASRKNNGNKQLRYLVGKYKVSLLSLLAITLVLALSFFLLDSTRFSSRTRASGVACYDVPTEFGACNKTLEGQCHQRQQDGKFYRCWGGEWKGPCDNESTCMAYTNLAQPKDDIAPSPIQGSGDMWVSQGYDSWDGAAEVCRTNNTGSWNTRGSGFADCICRYISDDEENSGICTPSASNTQPGTGKTCVVNKWADPNDKSAWGCWLFDKQYNFQAMGSITNTGRGSLQDVKVVLTLQNRQNWQSPDLDVTDGTYLATTKSFDVNSLSATCILNIYNTVTGDRIKKITLPCVAGTIIQKNINISF